MDASFLADASHPFSLYQIAGWVGVGLFLVSYQVLTPRKTIFFWIPADALFAVHFFGLGSFSTMCVSLGAIVRDSAAVFLPRRSFLVVLGLYLTFVWVMMFYLAQAPYEYLAALGTSFLTIATLYRDRFVFHRLFSYGHQLTWLVLFIYIGSYPGFTQMVLLLLSNSLGFWRYIRQRQRNPHED